MSSSAPIPLDPAIGIAVLAAGAGRRLGGGKLLRDLGGRPLWCWAMEAAEQAGFATRWLIRPPGVSDEAAPAGWRGHINPDAGEGIAASIRLAGELARNAGSRRLVIALADMPFVEPAHLRALALGQGVLFTRYPAGHHGVPAAFPHGALPMLATLRGDRGAGTAEWERGVRAIAPECPESLLDIDSEADLDLARSRLG